MTYQKVYQITKDNRIIIQLPDKFKFKQKVKVIIEAIDESREEKIKLLKKASKDPLFLEDINEVNSENY